MFKNYTFFRIPKKNEKSSSSDSFKIPKKSEDKSKSKSSGSSLQKSSVLSKSGQYNHSYGNKPPQTTSRQNPPQTTQRATPTPPIKISGTKSFGDSMLGVADLLKGMDKTFKKEKIDSQFEAKKPKQTLPTHVTEMKQEMLPNQNYDKPG